MLAFASRARAEVRSITLGDAVHLAAARNPTIGAASFAVVEADGDRLRALGAYDATLELSVSGLGARHDARVDPLPQETARDAAIATATVTKRFEDGTRATIRVGESAARNTTVIPSPDATQSIALRTYTPKLEAGLEVPFLGGRIAGGAERDRLEALRDATELERGATADDVLRDAAQAYWELAFAQREATIRAHSAALAEAQLRLVEAEIARGARPRLAAAEVEEELARRREDALLATGGVAERSVALASLLGLPPTTELRAADEPRDPAPVDREHALALALARNPRVTAAIRRGDASAAELDRADDEARWRVDGFVRGSLEADADTAHDAWTRAAGYGGWTVEAGVKLQLPLAGTGARGAVGAARARLTRARIRIADAEAQVAAELTRAIGRLDIALLRRATLARSVELALTNLDAEQRRWERGDTTSFEVLRRQTALADATLRAERARIDAISARAAIDALTATATPGGSSR